MHKNQLVLLKCEILLLLKDGNVCLYKKRKRYNKNEESFKNLREGGGNRKKRTF